MLSSPKRFLAFQQSVLLLDGRPFSGGLISQNFVYLGVPVRISAWIIFAIAVLQWWLRRRGFVARIRTICSDAEIRATAVVILLTISFHGIVPVEQGLGWFYGKGHFDQINYVLLAEFLKEEPYGTGEQQIGLRPWSVGPVGSDDTTGQLRTASHAGMETIGLKTANRPKYHHGGNQRLVRNQ